MVPLGKDIGGRVEALLREREFPLTPEEETMVEEIEDDWATDD